MKWFAIIHVEIPGLNEPVVSLTVGKTLNENTFHSYSDINKVVKEKIDEFIYEYGTWAIYSVLIQTEGKTDV